MPDTRVQPGRVYAYENVMRPDCRHVDILELEDVR
jgi:hypothetical protein